jgi:hypothetical protein
MTQLLRHGIDRHHSTYASFQCPSRSSTGVWQDFNSILGCKSGRPGSTAQQGLPRTLPGAGILPATGQFYRPAFHSNRPTLIPVIFSRAYSDFPLLYLPVPSGFHRLSSRQRAGLVPSAPAEPQFPSARSRAIAIVRGKHCCTYHARCTSPCRSSSAFDHCWHACFVCTWLLSQP